MSLNEGSVDKITASGNELIDAAKKQREKFGVHTSVTSRKSSMKMEKGIQILVVTLGSSSRQSRWTEHTKLFKWASKNLGVKPKKSVKYKQNQAL